MKKVVLAAFAVLAFVSVNAQDFRAGVSAGLPVGDASDFTSVALSADLGYLVPVSDVVELGPTVGYTGYIKEHSNGNSISFLPVAASGRFNLTESFTLGADLGYGIGLNDGNDGGFYYAPKAQYAVAQPLDIVLAYRGVSRDGSNLGNISLGVEFKF